MAKSFNFPPIYLLPAHLEPGDLHYFEEAVDSLTYDIHEAELVVGRISKRERAEFELRRHRLRYRSRSSQRRQSTTIPVASAVEKTVEEDPPLKRRKVVGVQGTDTDHLVNDDDLFRVVKLSWLTDCLAQERLLPVDGYVLFEGFKITSDSSSNAEQHETHEIRDSSTGTIFQRAAEDQAANVAGPATSPRLHTNANEQQSRSRRPPPSLLRQTTSEHDIKLPDIPDFLHTTYSCQRPTPLESPNEGFIAELKKIRTLRLLQGDQIGVRAYSTSIATLSAYLHVLQSPHEIERLRGCSTRIAELYQEWLRDGETREVAAAASDAKMSTLQLFYDIWGVGDVTAREFYRKGWRDLDDLVEYGWQSLTRVQQIGVKYYDEFQQKISRQEVEQIASLVLDHARLLDPEFEMVIVGGYRRGKKESGDVDVVLSHREESQTMHMVEKLVLGLEQANLITHTLSLWTYNSERGQLPLAWRGERAGRGSGFDTLDKALVVWQDKQTMGHDAPHRRVDIIVSPWKTVGCAILGWSGGTTFQRDLRRYCKQEKGLKFDSSGIRRSSDGSWMDFESRPGTSDEGRSHDGSNSGKRQPAPDMHTAEKRVFEGLGLPWRDPTERCTG